MNQKHHHTNLYKEIVERMAEGVVLVRIQDLEIVYTNDKMNAMFGYDNGELLGQQVSILHYGDDAQTAEEAAIKNVEVLKQIGDTTTEIKNVKKDGTPITCRVHISVFDHHEYGNVWIGIHEDITESRQSLEDLRDSESKYRMLFENMTYGVFYQRTDGVLIDCNPAVLEMFGLTREQFLSRTSDDPEWKAIREDGSDFPGDEHPSMVALRTGKPVCNVVAGAYNPQKEKYFWFAVNAIPQFRPGEDRPHQVFVTLHDITKNRLDWEALIENENRHRIFVENMNDGMAIQKNRLLAYVNDAFCRISGYTRNELLDKDIASLFDDANREKLKTQLAKRQKGVQERYEIALTAKNGNHVHLLVSPLPLQNENNVYQGSAAIFTEITAQKLMEKRRRFQRDLSVAVSKAEGLQDTLQAILDTIFQLDEFDSGGIYLIDRETGGLYFAAHQGLPQDFVDRVMSYGPGDIRTQIVMKGEPIYLPVDEYPFPIQEDLKTAGITALGMIPIKYGEGVIGAVNLASHTHANIDKTSKDILKGIAQIEIGQSINRAIAEEALKESEQKFRSMLEAMKDAVYICSSDFRIEYMNPRMVEKLGRNATGEICYKALFDNKGQCAWCPSEKIQQGEHIEQELTGPTDNRWYHVTNSPIRHTDGTISKISIYRDITDQKRMEYQLLQKKKLESIGTLSGAIAHEFNNILHMVIGNVELAIDDIPSWNPVRENLEVIKTASLRAAGIVKQLIKYSHQSNHELKPLGVTALLQDTLIFLRSTLPASISIQSHLPEREMMMLADSSQISQVLINVCINASQAMEGKGGKLTIRGEKTSPKKNWAGKKLELPAVEYAKITISDTGRGIAPEVIDQIFDPYFTTQDFGKGAGMGLATAHSIVKNHNGMITVDSKPGKGATFTIHLPLMPQKTIDESPKASGELPRGCETIRRVLDEK